MTPHSDYTILSDDDVAGAELSEFSWARLVTPASKPRQPRKPVFVLATASRLQNVSTFVRLANKVHHLKGLFIRSDVDPLLLPQLMHRADLRVFRNTLAHSETILPRRVIQAWHYGMQDRLIATARVVEDRLMVITAAFQTLEVAFSQIRSLRGIPEKERESFEISSEGSYIHWRDADIHLDIDAVRYATDDKWRLEQKTLRLSEDHRMGRAIQKLRTSAGLRQADIRGLSERQVRRLERGARATQSALSSFATAHGVALDDYLRTLADSLDDV